MPRELSKENAEALGQTLLKSEMMNAGDHSLMPSDDQLRSE